MDKQEIKTFINDIGNREDITNIIVSDLRKHGIKYRKEKRLKLGQEKTYSKRIFNAPLHTLELTDVILANGCVAQVPVFVSNACQRILEQISTEGLFRKAGSTKRQQEIKASIESGNILSRSHHVIDIANILKTFFRDLPEPLLPTGSIQEALIRCLLSDEHKVYNLLLTCLLLPPITINTLAFFMQFLHTVSLHSNCNKMTAENLAIIFTPNLMPIAVMIQQRLSNHVKVIQLLIENSHKIGVIPRNILDRIRDSLNIVRVREDSHSSFLTCSTTEKKKKRRSGSITRMFNGLKKMVSAVGSSETLDKHDESLDKITATPCLNKSSKKRKLPDGMPFSAKKKKEVISSLPNNQELLPYTPIALLKDEKKTRLSLGGHKQKENKYGMRLASDSSVASIIDSKPMERRWSLVGAPWTRKKRIELTDQAITVNKIIDGENDEISGLTVLSPVTSMPNLRSSILGQDQEHFETETVEMPFLKGRVLFEEDDGDTENKIKQDGGEEYLRISKSEYEAIKQRVSAIETRISQEFENIRDKSKIGTDALDSVNCVNDKYHMTLKTTESMEIDSLNTNQLAKRLGRELKIRRSAEHFMLRSPSARKIGSMRRRSCENVRVSRNQSWHLGSHIPMHGPLLSSDSAFYPKTNLRRGRPNTVQSGLRHPELSPVRRQKSIDPTHSSTVEEKFGRKWTNTDIFTINVNLPTSIDASDTEPTKDIFKTPEVKGTTRHAGISKKNPICFEAKVGNNNIKTPMLPPEIPPRKTPGKTSIHLPKTPGLLNSALIKDQMIPLQELQSGRASIARLRSQNAGMVLAKAKLFDGIVSNRSNQEYPLQLQKNHRISTKFVMKSEVYNSEGQQINMTESFERQVPKSVCTNYNPKNQQRSTPRKRTCTKSPRGGINRREKLRVSGKPSIETYTSPRLIRHLRNDSNALKSSNRANTSECFSPNLYDLDNKTPHIRRKIISDSSRCVMSKNIVQDRENRQPSVRRQTPLKESSFQKLSLVSHDGCSKSNNYSRRESS